MEVDPAMALEIAALARQRQLQEAVQSGHSDIQQFFADSTVFLTGGTGFLGKLLIEKLLRSCPNIKRIYILVRPKKEKAVAERLADLVADPVFNEYRKTNSDFASKIFPLQGDVSEMELGMSEKDRQIVIDEANVVFHAAATIRFDEPLRRAVLVNVRGTRELLALAARCPRLRALVHVSTAYSHCARAAVRECFYPSPLPYRLLIDLAEGLDDARLDRMTPTLLSSWPNTYAFTKAVAEDAVRELGASLPAVLFRPAIVVGTYREPAPGWVDMSSVYGPSGVILGTGLGVVHTFVADLRCKLDLVPADFVNNACIAAAWRTGVDRAADRAADRTGDREPAVYIYSSSKRNTLTWNDINRICNVDCRWMVSPRAIWYCFAVIQTNWLLHAVLAFLWHTIPGYLADGVSFLLGKQPRFRSLYKKVDKLNEVLAYFSTHQWDFDDENTQTLYKSLSPVDKEIFQFDINTLDWCEYIQLWYLGIRRYIVKDDLKNTKLGVRKQFAFKVAHYLLMGLYCYVFWKIVTFAFSLIGVLFGLFN